MVIMLLEFIDNFLLGMWLNFERISWLSEGEFGKIVIGLIKSLRELRNWRLMQSKSSGIYCDYLRMHLKVNC